MLICIPTYQRSKLLQRDTLAYLQRCQVDPKDTMILVASEEERYEYDNELPEEWADQLRVTVPGLSDSRNYARHHYLRHGEEVVWMDDDISSLQVRLNDHSSQEADIREAAQIGFEAARAVDACLWGVYPTVNPLWMKAKTRYGLWHCVGCLYGEINGWDDTLDLQYGDAKEDYERCLRHYERYGLVVRMEWYAPKTVYYRESGGIQGRTRESVEDNIRRLQDRWPGMIRRNERRKSDYPEILLVNPKVRAT